MPARKPTQVDASSLSEVGLSGRQVSFKRMTVGHGGLSPSFRDGGSVLTSELIKTSGTSVDRGENLKGWRESVSVRT